MTPLQAAAGHMSVRYAEMISTQGMLAEHSPTIRAVVNAIEAEQRLADPYTIIRDLLDTLPPVWTEQKADAINNAKAWLAENAA